MCSMWREEIRLTADDFGLHPSITDGIMECIEVGVINSISIMANGYDFERAVHLIKNHGKILKGVHVALTEVEPLLRKEVPSLLKGDRPFHHAKNFFLLLPFIKKAEIYEEAKAQIERVVRYFPIDHLNSHQHVHLFPGIFEIFLTLARQFKIPYIRLVKEKPLLKAGMRNSFLFLFNSFYPFYSRKLKKAVIQYPESTWGFLTAGTGDFHSFAKFLKKKGKREAILHPGIETESLMNSFGYWNYFWNKERNMLLQNREFITSLISLSPAD